MVRTGTHLQEERAAPGGACINARHSLLYEWWQRRGLASGTLHWVAPKLPP
jgi:hypothetical protein